MRIGRLSWVANAGGASRWHPTHVPRATTPMRAQGGRLVRHQGGAPSIDVSGLVGVTRRHDPPDTRPMAVGSPSPPAPPVAAHGRRQPRRYPWPWSADRLRCPRAVLAPVSDRCPIVVVRPSSFPRPEQCFDVFHAACYDAVAPILSGGRVRSAPRSPLECSAGDSLLSGVLGAAPRDWTGRAA